MARWYLAGEKDEVGRITAGAAFCRQCRAKTQKLSSTMNRTFPAGTCYENLKVLGPEGCVKPAPEFTDAEAAAYWQMFGLAGYGGVSYRGMDGDPVGHRLTEVRCAADALGIPWDGRTMRFFSKIESMWQEGLAERLEERDRERKRRTRTPHTGGRRHLGG